MVPGVALELVAILDNLVQEAYTRRDQVPFFMKVLIFLRFAASGSYQRGIGENYRHPVSQTMISRIIRQISTALVRLAPTFIKFPETRAEREQVLSE